MKIVQIDASTYRDQISLLAEVIAQKVKREGPNHLGGSVGFHSDIFILIRQARNTYNFMYWVHSDDVRDIYGWRDNFTFACEPLVRTLMDNLFNITLLLQDPHTNGKRFRASGLRKGLQLIEAELARYKGQQEWDEYIADSQGKLAFLIRNSGLTEQEVRDEQQFPGWPTLGKYLRGQANPHRDFLRTFMYGRWKMYSAVAHGAPEGLHEIGMFLNRDGHLHEDRPNIDEAYPRMMSTHLMRTAILLLAIITEVQAAYQFKDEGARINERIVECWQALQPAMEGKEIYDEHYAQLMKDKGIG